VKLVWTGAARADRRQIFEYIEVENPRAAAELDNQFERAAALLQTHPEMGRPGRLPGTREFVVHRRYFLLYQVDADTVRILGVVHTARLWPPAPGD